MLSLDTNMEISDTKGVYQLVKLDNTTVVAQWNEVEQVFVDSFVHIKKDWNEEEKTLLLKAVSDNQLQCWGVFKDNKLIAFATTAITIEFWGEKKLLIFSLYGFDRVSLQSWHKLISDLSKYAKSSGCKKIVAFTNNERVIEIVKMYGGDFSAYIEMEI